jgi:hypothetical protein
VREQFKELENVVPLQGLLGYLNFAGGKPDARFEKHVSDAFGFLADHGAEIPWDILREILQEKLVSLNKSGAGGFQNIEQAAAILALVFNDVLPAYRRHHSDLLHHLSDRDLLQPFFLARVFEAVLSQGGPWGERQRIVKGAVNYLNDFVGHRPIATLENRPKGELYAHERVRPIPLFINGAGAGSGRYHDLIAKALEIIAKTEPAILQEAYFDPELLEELAVDPRAYDHGHPANRRPNYVFGEWDPHRIDNQGRYRRYVVRQVTLDALMDQVERAGEADRANVLFEAAAVLAGTMLMAAGTSGAGPTTHDSTTTLASLVPRIAQYRDAFYAHLLARTPDEQGERLRAEAATLQQPFGRARQTLNHFLARHRAAQLQHRQLALLFAEMGYPEASRKEASRIPAASIRLLSEILCRITSGHLLADKGKLGEAVAVLPDAEDLLHRGIFCGALADPWNILGFQGLFPLFTAREDSIRDTRIDDLTHTVEQTFVLYTRLISEAAASGKSSQCESLVERLRRLAEWWDQYASYEVSDVRRVHGAETAASAEHIAKALTRWHERGETAGDIAFWKNNLEGIQTPKAFALIIDALLRRDDFRASMALLMNWLGQADTIPLENGDYSFQTLALRWMLAVTGDREAADTQTPIAAADRWSLVRKFFDYLEANAEEYWQIPPVETGPERIETMPAEAEESLYSAAYEDMTFHDSADDNQEGSIADEGERHAPFPLEYESERLAPRLQFHTTVARLWHVAAGFGSPVGGAALPQLSGQAEALQTWLETARAHQRGLLGLLDGIQAQAIPAPLGSYDSLVEYDRRRVMKEQLLYTAINTCLETFLAMGTLQGSLGTEGISRTGAGSHDDRPPWESPAIELEQAALQGDEARARRALPVFLAAFQQEALIFTPLAEGGEPRQVLRVRVAQSVLRALVETLPRLGLLRETWHVLTTARKMEQAYPAGGKGITEFNHLFQAAYQGVIDAVVSSSDAEDYSPARNQEIVDLLEKLTRPFLGLWMEHSQTVQLSALETVREESEWNALSQFVKRYGRELFHAKFMTLANLRGILHRGVGSYLDYLRVNEDPLHPVALIAALDRTIPRNEAQRWFTVVMQALVENYEEYKDYNSTTAQSDYGENLYFLLDFLRLKVAYERHSWRLRPLAMAHEVLARANRWDLAASWQEAFERLTKELADQYEAQLAQLEQSRGMRIRTVADRIHERFVKQLALDRLCALIEPAMDEATQTGKKRAFSELQKELKPLVATPTGVGLDLPEWLRGMEAEVRRVEASRSSLSTLANKLLGVPQVDVPLREVRKQIDQWDEPI